MPSPTAPVPGALIEITAPIMVSSSDQNGTVIEAGRVALVVGRRSNHGHPTLLLIDGRLGLTWAHPGRWRLL